MESFSSSKSLKEIEFGRNSEVGDDEATALATLLRNNHHIDRISVRARDNGMSTRGSITLLRAIQERSVAFRGIDLSVENLGSEVVQELSRVIENSSIQLKHLRLRTYLPWNETDAFETYHRIIPLLVDNDSLNHMLLPSFLGEFSVDTTDRLARLFSEALKKNHTFHFIGPLSFEGQTEEQRKAKQFLEANRKGPVAAPVLKGQPLPTKYVADLPDFAVPSAIARCDKLAKLDLIYMYAFVKQMNDTMVQRIDTAGRGKRKVEGIC